MSKFLKLLVIALFCGFAQTAHATWIVPERLTNQVEIETLKNVRNVFFSTKEKVLDCLKSGRSDQDCLCENEKNYAHLNQLILDMFEKYPNWGTALELRYIDGEEVKSIMPQELKRQTIFDENCISYILI